MSIELRPYQAELIDRVRAAFAGGARAVLMQLGTGGGKTAAATAPIEECVRRGRRAVFLAHLDALLDDTYERLLRAEVPCGIVQGDRPADPTAPVQVASLQTLDRRGHAACPEADIVFVDEAHRSASASVQRVLRAYPRARIIGLTATPQRGDGKPLSEFEIMVCGPSVKWLTANRFLVPCDVVAPARFAAKGLVIDPVDAYEQSASATRAIVFASSVAHAKDLEQRFSERGWRVAIITATTPRALRRELRERLAAGDLEVLIGVTVFLEGWDCPEIETVILARAFSTTSAFLQAIGRGLRPSPGKARCTVLDLRGAVNLHGLPDEDRRWSLEGHAVVRTETLPALAHCKACFAIFRPAGTCPRCGAAISVKNRVQRVLTRAEKLEKYSHLPPAKRDERYLEALKTIGWRIARSRMHFLPDFRKKEWVDAFAMKKFVAKFGRSPEAA